MLVEARSSDGPQLYSIPRKVEVPDGCASVYCHSHTRCLCTRQLNPLKGNTASTPSGIFFKKIWSEKSTYIHVYAASVVVNKLLKNQPAGQLRLAANSCTIFLRVRSFLQPATDETNKEEMER